MTKDFAESLADIIASTTDKHPNDIGEAVKTAYSRVKRLRDYDGFLSDLVCGGLRQRIHDYRHNRNVEQRQALGDYGGAAKVDRAGSSAVAEIAEMKSAYDYFIGGKSLGMMSHEDLVSTQESESERAAGHSANADLCEQLAKITPDGKTVREAVGQRKIDAIFKSVFA